MGAYETTGIGSSNATAPFDILAKMSDYSSTTTLSDDGISTNFSSVLKTSISDEDQSASPKSTPEFAVDEQARLLNVTDQSDLKVKDDGFLVVEDPAGKPLLTQADSFALSEKGQLVDDNGNALLGYPYSVDSVTPIVNDYSSLQPISLPYVGTPAEGSSSGSIVANLDSSVDAIDSANLPSATSGENTQYSHRTSISALNRNGDRVNYDVYFSKTADNKWQMSIFDAAGRDHTTGAFPYASGALVTAPIDLEFDSTGRLTKPSTAEAAAVIPGSESGGTVPDMKEMTLYFAALTQGPYDFTSTTSTDGNSLSVLEKYHISNDGVVYAQYSGGLLQPWYHLAVAQVENPNELSAVSDKLYSPGGASGSVILGVSTPDNIISTAPSVVSSSPDKDILSSGSNALASNESVVSDLMRLLGGNG